MSKQRPTLEQLAAEHARHRFTKKRRNADLRQHGYDPDGNDGHEYRLLFNREVERCRSEAIAHQAVDLAHEGHATQIVLWIFPPEDHAAWTDAGMGDVTYQEYLARVAAVEREAHTAGIRTVHLHATFADMLAELDRRRLPNDPNGRAAVAAFLAVERNL